jgi:hypothetical protein
MTYRIDHPAPHELLTMRREPLGAVPGFRGVCSCGCEAWRGSEDRIEDWMSGHQRLRGSM